MKCWQVWARAGQDLWICRGYPMRWSSYGGFCQGQPTAKYHKLLDQRAIYRGSPGTAFGHAGTKQSSPWILPGLSSSGLNAPCNSYLPRMLLLPLQGAGVKVHVSLRAYKHPSSLDIWSKWCCKDTDAAWNADRGENEESNSFPMSMLRAVGDVTPRSIKRIPAIFSATCWQLQSYSSANTTMVSPATNSSMCIPPVSELLWIHRVGCSLVCLRQVLGDCVHGVLLRLQKMDAACHPPVHCLASRGCTPICRPCISHRQSKCLVQDEAKLRSKVLQSTSSESKMPKKSWRGL